jgi:VIT1/CCC1 family predicted Fe2+/Mn2+ transporter
MLKLQQGEINQHEVYSRLSRKMKENNRKVLKSISSEELEHYNFWRRHTQKELEPERIYALKYDLLSFIFGFTFSIKLMESNEKKTQKEYELISKQIPEAKKYLHEEEQHETSLIALIDEKRLSYLEAILSGLNDAWMELIGELAGFTFAFQDPRLIGFAGLIAGIAQFLSSSASEIQLFISKRNEETENALKGSLFEGIIYLLTVGFLIFPYFVLSNYWLALVITISTAMIIVTFFTYYSSVVRSLSFRSMFPSMLGITAAVGAAAFAIGVIAKAMLNL